MLHFQIFFNLLNLKGLGLSPAEQGPFYKKVPYADVQKDALYMPLFSCCSAGRVVAAALVVAVSFSALASAVEKVVPREIRLPITHGGGFIHCD
jgi:hypothetical protein